VFAVSKGIIHSGQTLRAAHLARVRWMWQDGFMPKDRKKTYSDHQSQAARLKKERESKTVQPETVPDQAPVAKKPDTSAAKK
jgi:hypothetical protein